MKKQITHSVQITADNSDVFNGTIAEQPPRWARFCNVQLAAPDSDWLYSLTMGGEQLARDSGPEVLGADNVGQDWVQDAGQSLRISDANKSGFKPVMNVNVVTAGVGVARCTYTD